MKAAKLSIVIPTYRRERVLVETIEYLLAIMHSDDELLVLDQTERHEPETSAALEVLAAQGKIRWERLDEPSIPKAMNQGLLRARNEIVLFVDDDIRPEPGLLDGHRAAQEKYPGALVVGRIIQPWQEGQDCLADEPFHFACQRAQWVEEFMGGNFSIRRDAALALGGFDENFVRVAYRFEAEFAHRWRRAGGRIWFEPAACLHHLKDGSGGTRSYGEHLATSRPDHAVGEYYFLFVTRRGAARLANMLRRFVRAWMTRFHARHPWRIPATWLAELRGWRWAWQLYRQGPRYVHLASPPAPLPQAGEGSFSFPSSPSDERGSFRFPSPASGRGGQSLYPHPQVDEGYSLSPLPSWEMGRAEQSVSPLPIGERGRGEGER